MLRGCVARGREVGTNSVPSAGDQERRAGREPSRAGREPSRAAREPSRAGGASRGDHGAFGALVERHHPMVVPVVCRLAGSDSFAVDAAQESAIRALIGLDRLRPPERFGAWYAAIALNVARRWLREVVTGPLPEGVIDRQQLDPAELAEAAEMAPAVRHAVSELAPAQRDATLAP